MTIRKTSDNVPMDSTLTWDQPTPFMLDVTVGDEHIDMMRHTNNVVYLTWLEQVAWAHSVQLGLGPAEYEAEAHGLVVREHRLRYEAASRFGELLRLGTWITQVDRLSLHRRFQFVRVSDGKTVFRAETHYVCVDIAEGRVRRMPAVFLQAYSSAVMPATRPL
jgi:acyl-CoA thioester hydrolase